MTGIEEFGATFERFARLRAPSQTTKRQHPGDHGVAPRPGCGFVARKNARRVGSNLSAKSPCGDDAIVSASPSNPPHLMTPLTVELTDRRTNLSDAKRTLLRARLQGPARVDAPIDSIPREAPGRGPLSSAQRRMWFFHELQPTSAVYNI